MVKVEIYVTAICPYCVRAKKLLDRKGVSYTVIDVSANADLRREMTERSHGRQTVPQIFIDDHSIGGCDDLYALEEEGKLDGMLGIKA